MNDKALCTKIIDISKHNTVADFKAVKAAGIDGVIIRAGYGRVISQKDKTFDGFYTAAKAAGLKVGAYWYSYAESAAEAEIEVAVFCKAIEGKCFELPIYFDIEEKKHLALGLKVCSEMIDRFCSHMEQHGYYAGIYSFDAFYGNISDEVKRKYTKWVARVENIKPVRCTDYDMWQYTWEGKVNGISGSVDISRCYKDFASIIKAKGLNGYSAAKYSVAASVCGIDKIRANAVAEVCKQQGMSVKMTEV